MKGRSVRISDKLVTILENIIKKESERGNTQCSYTVASDILCKRIENAGGLKENF